MSDERETQGEQRSAEPPAAEKQHVFDTPRNVRRVIHSLYAVCALLLAIDLLDLFGVLYHKHVHFAFEHWFGFYGFFGFFLSCALVLIAKAMRRPLKRDEDYYDR